MRFFGKVGYATEGERQNGVWVGKITEKELFGDVIENSQSLVDGSDLNPDMTFSNSISVVADDYAREHFTAIRYVEWAGVLVSVTNVKVQYPRLLLRLGGVYNGEGPTSTPGPPGDRTWE